MHTHVFGQVVGAQEDPRARAAAEALGAGVRLQVALQLVRAREALAAEQPVADEGPVAAVPAQVRLEVRRLHVGFPAAGDVAVVQVLALVAGVPQRLGAQAVGTAAGGLAGSATAGATLRFRSSGGTRGIPAAPPRSTTRRPAPAAADPVEAAPS